MPELSGFDDAARRQNRSVHPAHVAGDQWGVIGHDQLQDCGVSSRAVSRWVARGKLYVVHRGVYAFGHPWIPIEGQLVAALLHAGPDAVLSHRTAAWWWGLIEDPPRVIEVSTWSHAGPASGVVVHRPRHTERSRHRRFPITPIPPTMIDFAAAASLNQVRRALAEADYRGVLDVEAIETTLGRGRPGSARLRQALKHHQPRLARTRSRLERAFLALCESARVPLPELNVTIGAWTVDALWRPQRLAVELDGGRNHHTVGQMRRDRRKELFLRSIGLTVVRYSEDQVFDEPAAVRADLMAHLGEGE
jgi:very-short-patch-repair endonuclease